MTLLSEVFNLARRFLGGGPRKDCLDRLPNEVILDILSLLSVVDIIRLRRVSKLYKQLTQDAALWKKLLRRADIPLPILPPTSQHTLSRMSGLDAERVLVRAHSLARNWGAPHPKALREWAFDTGAYRVLEMAVLPGGNHLVTAAAAPDDRYYSLIVWDMDVRGRPKMVAAIATDSKAYDIQARYMTVDGEKSIVIAYLQREYHRKRDREAAQMGHIQRAGQLSTYHKIDAPFRYECVTGHFPLENLQRYVDIPYPPDTPQYRAAMATLPKAFCQIAKIVTSKTLSCPVLGELFGDPYLVVVKDAKDIIFKKLVGDVEERATATMTCMDAPNFAQSPHAIKAIRLLPEEHSVFVVREVDTPRPMESRRPTYLFEIYPALQCGRAPKNQQHFPHHRQFDASGKLGDLTHIYVPDFPPYMRPADLADVDTKMTHRSTKTRPLPTRSTPDPPPPIVIYAHRSNPEGIIRILFHAQCFVAHLPPSPVSPPGHGIREPEPTHVVYRHTLQSGKPLFQRVSDPDDVLRIIPAATRPLVCLADWDDLGAAPAVAEVRPFVDRGWEARPCVVDGFVLHPRPGATIGSPCFARTDNGEGNTDADKDGGWGAGPGSLGKRVAAFGWEESIGRLVVAEDGVNALIVYDFAAAPRHDKERRKRPQDPPPIDPDVLMKLTLEPAPAPAPTPAAAAPHQVAGPSRARKRQRTGHSARRVARGSSATACR